MDVDGCILFTIWRFRECAPEVVSEAFWKVQLYATIETWQLRMRCWSWNLAKSYAGFRAEVFVGYGGMDSAMAILGRRAGNRGFQCQPYHLFGPLFSMIAGVGYAIQDQGDPPNLCYYVYGIEHREILLISRVCHRECRNKPLELLRIGAARPDQ